MRGYFSIMGGLAWLREPILANVPPHHNRVELTCGRGELIWLLPPPAGAEILNDKDEQLIRMHLAVQRLNTQDHARLEKMSWVLCKEDFDRYRAEGPVEDDVEFLRRMIYLFAGGKRGDEVFKDVFWRTRAGKDYRGVLKRVAEAQSRFRSVQFTTLDAVDCLEAFADDPDCFVFIDPPYPSRERYYRVHDLQWKKLATRLRKARCKWMLVSDCVVSPRVGAGKRLGKPEVVQYITESHSALIQLATDFHARHFFQPFRMQNQYKQQLKGLQDRRKNYLIVTNYGLIQQDGAAEESK